MRGVNQPKPLVASKNCDRHAAVESVLLLFLSAVPSFQIIF
jgi:hypothetical protein